MPSRLPLLAACVTFEAGAVEKIYNLVMVTSDTVFDPSDFHVIAKYVEEIAPEVEVFVVDSQSRSPVTRKKAAKRPSLIFSPMQLMAFQPDRGKVYCGRPMPKIVEMDLLTKAGLPVPAYAELRPDTPISEERYGPYTLLKAGHAYASFGSSMELFRTQDVRYRPPESFPEGHDARRGPMFVQKFIDCGKPMNCRVLTLFGVPLFTYCVQAILPLALDEKEGPFVRSDFVPTTGNVSVYMEFSPDILLLAKNAYHAVPDVPLQACDILRDKNGNLHILEINPGGATWMFSTYNSAGYKRVLGIEDLAAPFDAFRTAAQVLVSKTRTEAI
jgi:hypothetical protein